MKLEIRVKNPCQLTILFWIVSLLKIRKKSRNSSIATCQQSQARFQNKFPLRQQTLLDIWVTHPLIHIICRQLSEAIIEVLHSLENKCRLDSNGLTIKFMKQIIHTFVEPLTRIFNLSFQQGKIPH